MRGKRECSEEEGKGKKTKCGVGTRKGSERCLKHLDCPLASEGKKKRYSKGRKQNLNDPDFKRTLTLVKRGTPRGKESRRP